MRDWLFNVDNSICNFRAVGVHVRDEKILVQLDKRTGEYALPGGHVRVGETSEQALIRELKEEADSDIVCKRLIWTEECFWEWNGTKSHTIAFYYLIDFADSINSPAFSGFTPQNDNENILLGWLPIEELVNITIYPEFLKTEIFKLDDGCKHFVTMA